MKVLTVVGARPQFIKEAVVFEKIRSKHTEILVHTGQHFDYNMSELFFNELGMPAPDYNLGISGGTHAEMTGKMMIALEQIMIKERPDCVLVYGDTNSTLAAVLAAAKLHIGICHVEAGVRTSCKTNPEEINRVCADHLSTLLLTSTQGGVGNLIGEGLGDRAFFVGDLMYDAFLKYREVLSPKDISLKLLEGGACVLPDKFYFLTCHREENTYDDKLKEILVAMNELDAVTIYPVHPRNKEKVIKLKKDYVFKNIIFTEPVGYLQSVCMINHAEKVVTDSGGLQREAFFAGKKCVTVLDFVCWSETMVDGRNELATPDREEIIEKLSHKQKIDLEYKPFGDGHAAKKILDTLEKAILK